MIFSGGFEESRKNGGLSGGRSVELVSFFLSEVSFHFSVSGEGKERFRTDGQVVRSGFS